ncbi:MAG TPA: amino acid adenylation domain-containing protein, partial [Thermoanaerobaculia bacterium]|nr:amino acid adenylation domain-containing protein [Thermoanaerobaculia bacterium]
MGGARRVVPENLAYVIYTSGSTGRPKGVLNAHRAVVNRLLWAQDTCRLTPADRVLQKTPISFDVSVGELFWPLLAGATLVLARPGGHRDSGYLTQLIAEQQITHLHFVPSMLQVFLAEQSVLALPSLGRVFASGEALPAEAAQRLGQLLPQTELWNLYGPTEAAVEVTAWRCEPGADRTSVPIGRPLANAVIHLLDRALRPVAIGVPGELYIGGLPPARGYLNRPDLTAERFLPDPRSAWPGARMVRTGDLARRLAGGEVDFLGRLDGQVKIRSLRIELGEVETVLAGHPEVAAAAVVARSLVPAAVAADGRPAAPGTAQGEVRLVAYVVAAAGADHPVPGADDASPRASERWRRYLHERLPDAMVPSQIVVLEALPLTPSGKVDRAALMQLPVPGGRPSGLGDGGEPRTPIELRLASIWSDVLGIHPIGARDDFFALGGHSLLANRVMSRLRATFGIELPLRELFSAPTVEGLGERVAAALVAQGVTPPAPPIRPVPRDGPLPLSFAQERLWFLDCLQPGIPTYHISQALWVDGPLRWPALERGLREVVRRHEALRTVFAAVDGRPVQVPRSPAALLAPVSAMVDLSRLGQARRERLVARLAEQESLRPFDLSRGPLLRVTLLRLAASRHALLLTLHHIVGDGWSMGILMRDTAAAYAAGGTSRLPPLPAQYPDYAVWQREWLQGEPLDRQVRYWRRRLAGLPELIELPADRPRPVSPSFRGTSCELGWPPVAATALREAGRQGGATLFMVVLAAFAALLRRYGRQASLAVGSPVAGRHHHELEDLIGFFVNTLVLRADVADEMSFSQLLEQVRESVLAALAHQDLPFERLVQEINPERSLGHTPLFQVMFSLQNAALAAIPMADLHMRPMALPSKTAKFDLTLVLEERPAGIGGGLEVNADLYDRATAVRFARHLERLAVSALAEPGRPLATLPLLAAAECEQLLRQWNDTREQAPPAFLHELVAGAMRQAPEAVALVAGERSLTYGELGRRARRVARALADSRVQPESVIGVLLPRSPEMVVAMLAIMEAGCAWLPLSPELPPNRLSYMLADAGVAAVLGDGGPKATVAGPGVLRLDAARADGIVGSRDTGRGGSRGAAALAALPPEPALSRAYVIYTSGSTGRPKGVELTHGGVVNLVRWHQRAYRLDASARASQVAELGFDAAVWEIWPYLASGGTVHLLPAEVELEPGRLARWLAEQGVTHCFLPTPLAEAVLAEPAALAELARRRTLR